MSSILRRSVSSSLFKNLHHKNTKIITRTWINVKSLEAIKIWTEKATYVRSIGKVPDEFQLIYHEKQTGLSMIQGLIFRIIGLGIIGLAFEFLQENVTDTEIYDMQLVRTKSQAACCLAFIIVACFAASAIASKKTYRIYYNAKESMYRIYGVGRIPFTVRMTECKEGTVVRRKFSWCKLCQFGDEFSAGNRNILVHDKCFKSHKFRSMFTGDSD